MDLHLRGIGGRLSFVALALPRWQLTIHDVRVERDADCEEERAEQDDLAPVERHFQRAGRFSV